MTGVELPPGLHALVHRLGGFMWQGGRHDSPSADTAHRVGMLTGTKRGGGGWAAARDQPVPDDAARLLARVPEWFGQAESNAGYIEAARTKETWTVRDGGGAVVGLTLVDRHFPSTLEVHLTVVDRAVHGSGVGTAMLAAIEADALASGIRLLEVKTLGPSHPDPGYARTRHFYEKWGFLPLEETDLWGAGTPCLIMVKPLGRAPLISKAHRRPVQKAVGYVIHEDRLLVFTHNHVPIESTGVQVPAGTIEPGESAEDAVIREVYEETGLRTRVVRFLGTEHYDVRPAKPEVHERHFFQLELIDAAFEERWTAGEEHPSDGSAPQSWTCWWMQVKDAHVLGAGFGARLGDLAPGTTRAETGMYRLGTPSKRLP